MSTPKSISKLNPLSKPFVPSAPPRTSAKETYTKLPRDKNTKKLSLPRLLSDREYRELQEKKEAELKERRAGDPSSGGSKQDISAYGGVNVRYAAAVERWAAFDDEEDFLPVGLPENHR